MSTRDRVVQLVQKLVQRSFLQYVALFTVTCLGFYLMIHYGTTWFNTDPETKQYYMQFLTAAGMALAVCLLAFFSRLL